jgi:hypothetical protein
MEFVYNKNNHIDDNKEIKEENKYSIIKTENLHKLVSKEDPNHIHKIIGFICFVNFIYQFFHTIFYGCTSMNSNSGLFLMFIHSLLSVSSMIFHIPLIRNKNAPMIYPEFRLHSIIFALRSVICFYFSYYNVALIYKILTCYLTMVCADIVSYKIPSKISNNKTTTMRDMPFDKNIDENKRKQISRFHSGMQVSATLYMLGNVHAIFFTLYPIQLSAFLMTLVRKNIITTNMWHRIYSFLLIINILCFNKLDISYVIIEIILFFSFIKLRFDYNVNKYISWTIIFNSYYIMNIFFEYLKVDYILCNTNFDIFIKGILIGNFIYDNMKHINL